LDTEGAALSRPRSAIEGVHDRLSKVLFLSIREGLDHGLALALPAQRRANLFYFRIRGAQKRRIFFSFRVSVANGAVIMRLNSAVCRSLSACRSAHSAAVSGSGAQIVISAPQAYSP
jgi:hypothetical protein